MAVTTNPNLPSSYVKPTVAVAIDTNAPASGNDSEATSVLLWGEQLAAGGAVLNTPTALGSVTDAINAYGTKSSIVRQLRAAMAQKDVLGAVKFYGVGVSEPSGGTAGTGQIVVSIPGGSNPSAAGGCTLTLGGTESVSVSWTTSDTATTIGDSIAAALNTLQYEPWGSWSNSTGTVTATANAKGAFLEDYPIRVVYSTQGGVYLGPGSITFSGSPGSTGSCVINCGASTITTALDSATQTTAALIAAAVRTAILASNTPITCGAVSTATLPLYFVSGEDYRRVSTKLTGITTTTIAITGGGAAVSAGTLVYAGTVGAGFPTLTTAIANVRAYGSFGKWVCPWYDATTVGALFTAISTDGNGAPNQNRGQSLTLCSVASETTTASFPGSTSPAMNANASNNNNGMRGAVCIFTDAAQPGYILAAKVASLRAASDPFTNYDGLQLTGTSDVPMALPSPRAIAAFTDANQNQAINDGLTPLGVVAGSLVIVFGRTTLSTTDKSLWDWSWIDQADAHRRDLRAQAAASFQGCSLISDSTTPTSRKDVSPASFKAFLRSMLRRWEAQGSYNGAASLASACDASINVSNAARLDAVYPESPKIPLHQIGMVAQKAAPSLL